MPDLMTLIIAILGATCAYHLGFERAEVEQHKSYQRALHSVIAEIYSREEAEGEDFDL